MSKHTELGRELAKECNAAYEEAEATLLADLRTRQTMLGEAVTDLLERGLPVDADTIRDWLANRVTSSSPRYERKTADVLHAWLAGLARPRAAR